MLCNPEEREKYNDNRTAEQASKNAFSRSLMEAKWNEPKINTLERIIKFQIQIVDVLEEKLN